MNSMRTFESFIYELSQGLSKENARDLAFLSVDGDGLENSSSCHCCHCGSDSLDLMKRLWRRNFYSESNMDTLISLLQEIGRSDLAEKCQQHIQQHLSTNPSSPKSLQSG